MEGPRPNSDTQHDEHVDVVERIERRRADPAYMEQVRSLVEQEAPTLALLARND